METYDRQHIVAAILATSANGDPVEAYIAYRHVLGLIKEHGDGELALSERPNFRKRKERDLERDQLDDQKIRNRKPLGGLA